MGGKEYVGNGSRLVFLDNLRTFVIFLVVLYHAGWVYERSGILSSVWIVDDPSKNDFAGIMNIILDIVVMPALFFISGFFTPLSLRTKQGWAFLKSRFNRLMVPWIIAVLVLIPLYKVIFLYSRDLPPENLLSYFHFSGGILINQGWLWFLPVLFLFDVLYFVFWNLNPIRLKINLKWTVFAVFVIGFIYSFCISIFGYTGWTKTILLDFQNERLVIYFLMFVLGALCHNLDIFNTDATNKKLYFVLCSTIWIPMNVYIILLINFVFNPGDYVFSQVVDVVLVWLGFHFSLLGLLYILINTFRYFLDKRVKVVTRMNKYSYGVYIIHFIVMGAMALILLNTDIASLAKYVILAGSTFIVSNLIVSFYKEIIQGVWNQLNP